MGRMIGESRPVPADDPMFKQGARLVGINRLKPSTNDSEKTTDGEPQTPTTPEPKEEK
jgi:hypothetical protein